jgi:hypothetical protein
MGIAYICLAVAVVTVVSFLLDDAGVFNRAGRFDHI